MTAMKIKIKTGRVLPNPVFDEKLKTRQKIFYKYPKGGPPLTGLLSPEPLQGQPYEVKDGYLVSISEERAAEIEAKYPASTRGPRVRH